MSLDRGGPIRSVCSVDGAIRRLIDLGIERGERITYFGRDDGPVAVIVVRGASTVKLFQKFIDSIPEGQGL
jgi:hypothetical protein